MNTHDNYQPLGGTPPHEHDHLHGHFHCGKALSWTAIVAGALAAIGISFLFNLFSLGAGLAAFTFNQDMYSVAIGGIIWLIICGIVSMFIAGWITGLVAARRGSLSGGCLHGFIAWCLALIVAFLLASHFTTMMAVPATGAAAQNGLPPIMRISTINADRTVTVNRAEGTRNADTRVQVTPKKVESTANKLGGAAIATFFIFLLGALAAMLGGYLGKKHCLRKCGRVDKVNP